MYKGFYNLHCKPFENTPDPDFLFLSAQHREALSSLLYGIEESKGFILISGSVGTGKTTLVRSFLQQTATEHVIINIINPKTSFDDVLELLAKKLSLDNALTNQLELLEAMKGKLIELSQSGRRAIILIDEAHLLPESALEEIRLLSNIEHEKEKLIQIVLVGQNEIYDLLEREKQKSLKQRIVINRQLTPLNAEETNGYIAYRLEMAGNNQQIFSRDALRRIWKKSRGTPRLINHICDNALLIGYATESSHISKKIVEEVIQDMEKKPETSSMKPRPWLSNTAYVALAASCLLAFAFFWKGGKQTTPAPENRPTKILSTTTSPQGHGMTATESALQEEISPAPAVDLEQLTASNPGAKHRPPIASPSEDVSAHEVPIKPQEGRKSPAVADTMEESAAPHGKAPEKIILAQKPKPRRLPSTKIQQLKPGDQLFDIAYKNYGTMSETIIDYIQQANGINDINSIYFGQWIRLPQLTLGDLISKTANNRYHIHYASFYSEVSALAVSKTLKHEGEDVNIQESTTGDNTIYRVYVGDFPDRKAAKNKLETLDLKYLRFLNGTTSLAFNK